jgi:hypothetical protein
MLRWEQSVSSTTNHPLEGRAPEGPLPRRGGDAVDAQRLTGPTQPPTPTDTTDASGRSAVRAQSGVEPTQQRFQRGSANLM